MMDKNPGLYCHIPFCIKKCPYCNFYSTTKKEMISSFLRAIKTEALIYSRGDSFLNKDHDHRFDTLYIGGGTPSILGPDQIGDLISHLFSCFSFSKDSEITIEVNPHHVSRGYLKALQGFGINRLSIGIQSFNPDSLAFLGRSHTSEAAKDVIRVCRDLGFSNIGIDLIYGLPCQSMESWISDIDEAIELSPEHISAYQLTIEEKTIFGKRCKEGSLSPICSEKGYQFFITTSKRLTDAGYYHYEVSNYAKDKQLVSRHNSKYWKHIPYLGLGPSAHSFLENRRWWNYATMYKYCKAIEEGGIPIEGTEELTKEHIRLESLYFAFRTQEGLDLKRFKDKFSQDLTKEPPGVLFMLQKEGKIKIEGNKIRSTLEGRALADALPLFF